MFLIKKAISAFILPPGIFAVLLIGFGAWFIFQKRRSAGIINCSIGILLWVTSVSPVADVLFKYLEKGFPRTENFQGDVIVLLNGGLRGDGPIRLFAAAELWHSTKLPIILCGRSAFNPAADLPKLEDILVQLGVSADDIILEQSSRDTIEHAKYAKELFTTYQFKSPILVTSAYHMKRSLIAFGKYGVEIIPFPTGFIYRSDKTYTLVDYLPCDFKKASIALKECLGLLFYRYVY